jgi:hypothetical protein
MKAETPGGVQPGHIHVLTPTLELDLDPLEE